MDKLDDLLKRNETVLVEVLSKEAYDRGHIPGAINIPVDSQTFDDEFQQSVPSKDTPVVVYCKDAECKASPRAAKQLTELGYEKVYHFEGGKKGWRDAGKDLEGETHQVQADIA